MKGVSLEPARTLLENFTSVELARLARRTRLEGVRQQSRGRLVSAITRHLSLDEIVEELRELFHNGVKLPASPGRARLDQSLPVHGAATVQVYSRSRPQLGHVLLARATDCLVLTVNSAPLFLENRWTVLARDAGVVPRARLYSAFVGPGRIHSSAEAAPPKTKPYMLDEGEYQLRHGRLRFEFERSGPISSQVTFLRPGPRSRRPEYLFEPIV